MFKSLFRFSLSTIAVTALLSSTALSKTKVGDPFPAFDLKQIGSAGQTALEKQKGKVVIVDYWASWCGPCKKSLPELDSLQKKLAKKGLVVIGLNEDDEVSAAQNFLKKHPVSFLQVFDEGKKVAQKCDIDAMPSSFILDKDQKVRFTHFGYADGDGATFEKEVLSLF